MCCVHEGFTLSPRAGSTEEVEQKVGEAGPKPTIFNDFDGSPEENRAFLT